jgi:predicted nucleic acid-binding protein
VIVVSNTSPLNYLLLTGSIDILPALFRHVVIPQAVATELADPGAPEPVRSWIARPPDWLEIRTPSSVRAGAHLHPGERDALSLALELNAGLVLVDDLAARRIARQLGLSVTETIGLLERAANRGLIDLRKAVEALRHTRYHIAEEVLEALLRRHQGQEIRASEGDC